MTKKLTKPAGTARRAVRNLALLATLAVAICARAATPTISNVKAQQRYPWNGLVDIDYTITGDTTGLNLSFSVRDGQNDKTYTPATFLAPPSAAEGTHRVTWSPKADGYSIISTNIVVTVLLTRTVIPPVQNGEYLVIDLSGGSTATSYPVSTLDAVPSGGWTTEYKTTKLVLRKLTGGTFDMGGSVSTTISKPFYIGVFEVTQRQYELVMGSNPCSSTSYGKGDDYPVHYVSYNDIRGSSNGAGWPASSTVDGDSFLGKIQSRTGLALDLPTEAQWEYACRAGTTTTYSYGDSADGQYMWYSDNNSSWTSHTVGTKLPNTWGLYDMHGNVWEWCLDWYGTLAGGTDPKGATSGSNRILRGGCWSDDASYCTSSRRDSGAPFDGSGYGVGFRLCCSAGLEPAGEHDMVQLWEGGPYWATTNIGAEKPEDYGYYFWWGDTVGYKRKNDKWVASDGSVSNYLFSTNNTPTYYLDIATLQSEGWITTGNVLTPEHDAAHIHWGGSWRMPTDAELSDLDSKCDWTTNIVNGILGYVVKGKGTFASASIFLPCAGYGFGISLYYAGSIGSYWSSVPGSDGSDDAWTLYFESSFHDSHNSPRYLGRSVRPVQGFTE